MFFSVAEKICLNLSEGSNHVKPVNHSSVASLSSTPTSAGNAASESTSAGRSSTPSSSTSCSSPAAELSPASAAPLTKVIADVNPCQVVVTNADVVEHRMSPSPSCIVAVACTDVAADCQPSPSVVAGNSLNHTATNDSAKCMMNGPPGFGKVPIDVSV